MLIKKPKAILITINDRLENRSKSITVYNTTVEEVLEKINKTLNEK